MPQPPGGKALRKGQGEPLHVESFRPKGRTKMSLQKKKRNLNGESIRRPMGGPGAGQHGVQERFGVVREKRREKPNGQTQYFPSTHQRLPRLVGLKQPQVKRSIASSSAVHRKRERARGKVIPLNKEVPEGRKYGTGTSPAPLSCARG